VSEKPAVKGWPAIFAVIFSALFWALLIGLLVHGCSKCHAADELIYVKNTGSMRDVMPVGTGLLTRLERTPFERVRIGQVVVYRHRKVGLVAHRVFERTADHLWTKGDTNPFPDDQYVTRADYVGTIDMPDARP
jgi:signal peptidase I